MPDWRRLEEGRVIPTQSYCDQPYVVVADDGAWVCTMTTGSGVEGEPGQHIEILRSTDQGRTWPFRVTIEPVDGPEASYSVLLKVPGGRLFCFYNHNTDDTRRVLCDPGHTKKWEERVDSQGHFVFKYSNDHGATWSDRRYEIPQRDFEIDRENPYQGKIKYFWNVGRAFAYQGKCCVPIHKVGGFGHGFFTRSEGALLVSEDLAVLDDPGKAAWYTLPEGDVGLRAPAGGGKIAEEQSFSVLSDGSLFCVYRTIDGHPAQTYSRDGGRTWDAPRYQPYADGRLMRHPRAANFAWRCRNGKYLYWFHNHGGQWYDDRNPVWVSGGIEADSPAGRVILWSQPEILLYQDHPATRISYPDLIEDGGYFVTETQKTIARVHPVPESFFETLWSQFERREVASEGLCAAVRGVPSVEIPRLASLREADATGFTLELWLDFDRFQPNEILLDARLPSGKGVAVLTREGRSLELVLNDGSYDCRWTCDGSLLAGEGPQHAVIVVDARARVVYGVLNGKFDDGGAVRQFGWGRISPHLKDLNGAASARLSPGVSGLRIYGRPLMTTEAIGNHRCGRESIL